MRRIDPNKTIVLQLIIFMVTVGVLPVSGISYSWLGTLSWYEAFFWGMTATGITLIVGFFLTLGRSLGFVKNLLELTKKLMLLMQGLQWRHIVAISLLAGVGEELLFRVLLQSWLIELTGIWTGVLVSSVIFGLFHLTTIMHAVIAALLGAAFGSVYVMTESLLLVASWHALYDLIALALIVKYPKLLRLKP